VLPLDHRSHLDGAAEAGRRNPRGQLDRSVEILDELKAANQIVTEKASPEDAEAFRQYLLDAAQAAANAAKEGGFFGFHAVRVSEGEEKMLASLREALSIS